MVGRAGAWLALLLIAAQVRAQPPAVPTTVQLPTISVFSVQTTVWAPDRGGTLLGGTSAASDQRRVLGPWPAAIRDVASTRAARWASVHVTIIDHAAIDQELLAEAARQGSGALPVPRDLDEQARWLTRHLGRADASLDAPHSVAEARAAHAREEEAQDRQAAEYLKAGQRALAAGNAGAARVYLQMASRSASPRISEEAKRWFEAASKMPPTLPLTTRGAKNR